jgi:hypothetical protein
MSETQTATAVLPDGSQQRLVIPANVGRQCAPGKDYLTPGRYAVNDINMMEAITQPLYSYVSYPAAGSTGLSFFQTPATGAVTLEDTNMTLAAQIANPNKFLVQGIGIDFLSGLAPVTLGAPSANSQWNDFEAVNRRGWLEFTIGSKNYLTVAPLMILPPRSHINGAGFSSDSTTPAAALNVKGSLAYSDGDVYRPIPLLLEAGQNFSVTIKFPALVPLPSADANTRIGVILYGTMYRPPQ